MSKSISIYTAVRWPVGIPQPDPVPGGYVYSSGDPEAFSKIKSAFQVALDQKGCAPGDLIEIKRPNGTVLAKLSIGEMMEQNELAADPSSADFKTPWTWLTDRLRMKQAG